MSGYSGYSRPRLGILNVSSFDRFFTLHYKHSLCNSSGLRLWKWLHSKRLNFTSPWRYATFRGQAGEHRWGIASSAEELAQWQSHTRLGYRWLVLFLWHRCLCNRGKMGRGRPSVAIKSSFWGWCTVNGNADGWGTGSTVGQCHEPRGSCGLCFTNACIHCQVRHRCCEAA